MPVQKKYFDFRAFKKSMNDDNMANMWLNNHGERVYSDGVCWRTRQRTVATFITYVDTANLDLFIVDEKPTPFTKEELNAMHGQYMMPTKPIGGKDQ